VFGVVITLLGVVSALDTNRLGALDAIVGEFLLVLGGLFICVLVGYRMREQAESELARGLGNVAARQAWSVLVRYVAPVLLLLVLWVKVGPTWAAVKTLIGIAS
jgi:SNF family Na+-dependent transporter